MDNGQNGTPISPQNSSTFSPPVQAPTVEPNMDFPAAIRKLTEGAKIARIDWQNTDYGFLSTDGWLSIYRNGEIFAHWKVNDGDLKGTDWMIVK